MTDSGFGIAAALTAALCWAIATRLFGTLGKNLSPAWLNCAKGAIAMTLLLITLGGRSLVTGKEFLNLQTADMGFLALSGALGIGVGDTAYFGSLNRLGPRLSLLLEAGAPIVTASLAWLFLNEELTATTLLGMGIAIAGITWTLAEQTAASSTLTNSRTKMQGVLWGVVAALAQAGSSVIARGRLVAGDVDPLESALVRLVAGSALALAIATIFQPFKSAKPSELSPKQTDIPNPSFKSLLSLNAGFRLVLATFLGTYLGIWLQQTALKYTLAGIAQTCLATTPLFILPVLYFTGERFSKRAIAGAMVTVLGIVVLLQS
ncbi:MAG: DMT family transporter [Cyanobacteria bacterium P01_C01_bin.89]